MITKWNCWYDI